MSQEGLPPLVPISLNRVFRLKAKLIAAIEDVFLGATVKGPLLHELVGLVHATLPGEIPLDVVFNTLSHLGGTTLTDEVIRQEAWRVAGNIHHLQQCYAVPPWTRQEFDEWVPMQVVACRLKRTSRKKKIGGEFTARILGGTPTTLLTDFFWLHGFCGNLAQHIGFSPPWKALPFKKCEEFVGLRFYGLVEGVRRNREILRVPKFEHIKCSGSLLNHNRVLLQKRKRMLGFRCPFNYSHPCDKCHVGYRDCPVAVHPETFVRELCVNCKKEKWFERRMVPLGICVECQMKRDLGCV